MNDLPKHLAELLAVISGIGPWGHGSVGFHTHPTGKGKNEGADNMAHVQCMDLEKRGLIFRHFDMPGYVIWVAWPEAVV